MTAEPLPFSEQYQGADFSPCRTWRYSLTRAWSLSRPGKVAFIGLNPSTADETADDPTVRRCCKFARTWGYGGIYMLNIFAFRATDPRDMMQAPDPIGPDNDEHILRIANRSDLIVCAWGIHGAYLNRGAAVSKMLTQAQCRLTCLTLTAYGHPGHPLYLKGDTRPKEFAGYGKEAR